LSWPLPHDGGISKSRASAAMSGAPRNGRPVQGSKTMTIDKEHLR
jgi:hypothetical protein